MSEEQTTATAETPQSQPVDTVEATPPSWRDNLSDDLKMDASLLKFNDVGSLAKSYVNAQRMIGADKIALPGEHATDDEWGEVYDRLGRPQTPQGYELSYGEGEDGEAAMGIYSDVAHKLGLNGKQAQGLLDWYTELESSGKQQADGDAALATEEGMKELRTEWGRAFDQKASSAHRAAKALLGSTDMFDEIELSDGRKLGDHPEIVRMFAGLADQISEDQLQGDTSEVAFTPDEAMRRIAEITAPDSPYWDKQHPQHFILVEEALKLREFAHPE